MMQKYKDFYYEVKNQDEIPYFCFHDSLDRTGHSYFFNAERYNFKECIEKIKIDDEIWKNKNF